MLEITALLAQEGEALRKRIGARRRVQFHYPVERVAGDQWNDLTSLLEEWNEGIDPVTHVPTLDHHRPVWREIAEEQSEVLEAPGVQESRTRGNHFHAGELVP